VPWSFPLHLFIGRFSRKFHFFEEDLGKFSGHGDPQDLAEIGFLNGKGMVGLRGWFRAHYLTKIIGEMKRDRYGWRLKMIESVKERGIKTALKLPYSTIIIPCYTCASSILTSLSIAISMHS
jgi:hypothetical protein